MSTTRLPNLLTALRDRVDSVTTLPAARQWANSDYKPQSGTPFVSDDAPISDTRAAALGKNAKGRTESLYTVRIHMQGNTAAIAGLAHAGSIADAFRAADPPMTVEGDELWVTEARVEDAIADGVWYVIPVTVFFQFDHS